MINRLKYLLLTILLLAAFNVVGQYSIDKVCVGSERYYRVTGEANATFTWNITDPAGLVIPQLSDRDTVGIIWNMAPGLYELSVVQHGENNCDANLELGTIEVFAQPLAFAGNTITQCNGSPVTLNGAAAENYASLVWNTSGDGTFDNDTILNPIYTPGTNDMLAGTVILALSASGMGNSGTCTPAVSTITITLSSILAQAISTPVTCSGTADGTVTITATGGTEPYTFTLEGTTNTTGIYTNLTAGNYTYTITDINLCETTGTVSVGSAGAMFATLLPAPVTCFGADNGSISVTSVTGGSGIYEYSLDNVTWQNAPVFTGLVAGTYTIYLRDSLAPACMVTAGSIGITEPEVLFAKSVHTNVTIPGADDGSITVINQSGGSLQYEYSIDGINWQTSTLFSNLPAGSYSVFIRDAAATDCFYFIGDEMVLDGISVTLTIVDASCNGYYDGQATAVAAGGTQPYTYLWNDPASQTTSTAINLSAGIYTVIVTDYLGNTATATDTISQPDPVIPAFDTIGPLCLSSVPPDLPATSVDGITGTWMPSTISTITAGTFTYTFTPDAGLCAVATSMDININDLMASTFAPIGPLCLDAVAPELQATSLEGFTGTWNPQVINTSVVGTTTYTFTPDADQCAKHATLEITINTEIIPVFESIGPLCQNSVSPELPETSLNGIIGSWLPANINTLTAGTSTYTFTPDAGQCAVATTMDITVNIEITPVFNAIGPLCQNSTPPVLDTISTNGVTGTWTPEVINTNLVGTTTYTFNPDTGQCAVVFPLEIIVNTAITPVFALIGPLCQNSTPPNLPATSLNGIAGTWEPSTVNTSLVGTTLYTFTPDAGLCTLVATMEIEVTNEIIPAFAAIGPLCLNSPAPLLPDTSSNGITGTWMPDVIITDVAGTTTYTFTPDADQCSIATTLDISVVAEIIPAFAAIGPLCQNSIAPALPATSINGITGTWVPAAINTTDIGTTIYTFTPDASQCGAAVTMAIQVTYPFMPVFAPIGPLCQNSIPPSLPSTSTNGITGNWNPSVINTADAGTSSYIFTPDAGQCATNATLDIEIVTEILPAFGIIGPLCQNSTPPALPATSINGITGTWIPALINTGTAGIATYTFTPDAGQCAIIVTIDIEVTNEIIPVFQGIGPLCLNSIAPVLPATSINGISGSWIPAIINTGMTGITTYTFTPYAGQCAAAVTMEIEVTNEIVPVFANLGPFCLNSIAPVLPAVSLNGISGNWAPPVINTGLVGTTTYTFTPDAGQCAMISTIEIEVTDEIIPLFTSIGPLCINSSAPLLPAISTNNITGTWAPAIINTNSAGITTYIFTPDQGQCGAKTTMNIEVTSGIIPDFALVGPICLNNTAPVLPAVSVNGITGNWVPATVNTGTVGTTNYTFTPEAGQCAVATTLAITISGPEITEIKVVTSTNGMPNGQATVNAQGNALPLYYSLDGTNWQNSEIFANLPAGTYTAWVKDANGCTTSEQFIILNTVTGDVGVLAGDVQSCINIPFEIPVMAYDFTNISAFTIQLAFDSSVLTYNGITQANDLLDGDFSSTFISPGILQISFLAADSITLLSEDLLLTLNFSGMATGISELQWNWLKCVIYSVNGYEIPAIYTKGSVEIRPAPQIYTEGSGTYCEGEQVKLGSGSLNGQNLTYNWVSPNGTQHAGQQWNLGNISASSGGEYHVMASDSTACSKTENLHVQVNPRPAISISEYDTLCAEQVFLLDPGTGFINYTWQDGSNAPQLETSAEGIYWVTVTDTNGCQGSDSVILIPCDINRSYELEIWWPNAFSPNGDGTNDVFEARYDSEVKITFQMLIFNKWGEQIFSSNDITKGWDGTFKGERCPLGMYTYVISFKAAEPYYFLQASPARGNVMLLK